jgi:hypothetical protein
MIERGAEWEDGNASLGPLEVLLRKRVGRPSGDARLSVLSTQECAALLLGYSRIVLRDAETTPFLGIPFGRHDAYLS